jgi:hypothetical protein
MMSDRIGGFDMGTVFKFTVVIGALWLSLLGCTMGKVAQGRGPNASAASTGNSGGDNGGGGGGGITLSGTGALSVPTADAIVARLQNGMQGNVSPLKGNFAKALAQVKTNMPKVTDPTKATGFDQVQLLVYAACSDLTTGTTPLMQSKYNVNPNNSIASNQANLVAAGVQILDQYVAGLASQGSASAQVNAALANLVQTIASDSTNTSKIAFMSICMAANVTGSTMMGF